MSRRRFGLATTLSVLVTASPAVAAYVCHPDARGTKRLMIHGQVGAYSLVGGEVSVSVRRDGVCSRILWRPGTSVAGERSAACVAARPTMTVTEAGRRIAVVRARGDSDRPDRIVVRDRRTGSVLRSWPLFNRPLSLDVDGDTAVFTTAGRDGFYGLRLTDGRIGLVGVNQRVDTPQIDPSGIVYQDNLYKRDDGNGRIVMKFVPRAEVERAIARGSRPIRTDGVVRDFSMDRQRVAIAVADPRGKCDRVLFWNISWNYVSRLTSSTEATCAPGHAAGGITHVALGGITAEWVTTYGDTSTLLSANIIACREWVIARLRNGSGGDRLGGISADGAVLAYAVGRQERELRGQFVLGKVIRKGVRGRAIADGAGLPVAVSVDSKRIATLRQDGTVDVRTREGKLVTVVRSSGVRAIALALRKGMLAVLTARDRLDLFAVASGRLVRSLPVPAGVRASVDLHFGVAVLTAGARVYGVDVASGRTALLAEAPATARAEIEDPGVVYQFNRDGHGYLRFIPFAAVRSALR
jgi:hypothetical protein